MPELIIILSGNICSGKSTLADQLSEVFGVHKISTYILLKNHFNKPHSRIEMQEFGEKLDHATEGKWIAEDISHELEEIAPCPQFVLVDCARIPKQIEAIRSKFKNCSVQHIHLAANTEILKNRYISRDQSRFKETISFEDAMKDSTESKVNDLEKGADIVIRNDHCTKDDVLVRVASWLGLYGRAYQRCVDVMVGGQYGSEGKGHMASYLAKEYDLLVRVGGPNAGHKAYLGNGQVITYHHLPSGTQHNPKAKLAIGPGATIYVPKIMDEIRTSCIDASRLFIDPQAMIISDEDICSEKSLCETIGSTGMGVGFAMARRITGRSEVLLKMAKDIADLNPFIKETREVLETAYQKNSNIFLEGTQGTGLSLYHGVYPYVTSRDTTVAGCLSEAGISPNRLRRTIMVCRTYPIRVESPHEGDSGALKQEISWKIVSERSRVPLEELNEKEKTSSTGRKRRVAEFDWDLLKKAASLNAPTDIALSFVDYFDIHNRNARRFEQLTEETKSFIEEVERVSRAPVSLVSTRFRSRSILDRRHW
ncbi:adenylosuccinate synthetase [Synergistaceae bacterium OttesenSCG-928-I11]|nr:adenylosuccinate synthetase [Synergistaceae bacterium OttesenSCG-928-I11]